MPADERRQQILAVAMQMFSQRGFRGTTTREIALAAGVSEAIVFRHFATKQDLYAAILDYKISKCGGLPAGWQPIIEAVERRDDFAFFYEHALGAMRNHEEDEELFRLFMQAGLEQHELSEMFFERFVVEIYEKMAFYIRLRQQEGAFRAVEPAIIFRIFSGMIMNHSMLKLIFDKKQRLPHVSNEDAASSFSEILLNGILKYSADGNTADAHDVKEFKHK